MSSSSKPKEKVSNLIKGDGSLTENSYEKAETLNLFFSSVFTKENSLKRIQRLYSIVTKKTNITLSNNEITIEDMKKTLNSLNSSKSPGPDLIHPRILKKLSGEISYPLVKLFHKTLAEGKIPKEWKLAEVRPIFRKGHRLIIIDL